MAKDRDPDAAFPADGEPDAATRRDDELLAPETKISLWEQRKLKIREEIERNRRGDYVVPTWVLVLALAAVIGLWAAVVIFA